ncbi:MAG TPA: hypothetical protein VGF88_14375 [Acidobacteriaceae bacterium]|jgi:hypothetical protein
MFRLQPATKHPARHGRRAWVPFGLLLIAVSSYLNKQQPTVAKKAKNEI